MKEFKIGENVKFIISKLKVVEVLEDSCICRGEDEKGVKHQIELKKEYLRSPSRVIAIGKLNGNEENDSRIMFFLPKKPLGLMFFRFLDCFLVEALKYHFRQKSY